MANECKKFALFACCLMTMQALRLVISTAGFCVVRFHIDPELFNIFISRLVNAVMMSQLFGNWLGDLIVFASPGRLKLYSIALANWAELICFFAGLASICAGEQGHLTGFYWSMVSAYFWWKVGEAPCTSIGALEVDWYFAGFTLSGVWAAMLKGVVMMFVTGEKGVHSDALGEVNVTVVGEVSVVGARSVKTTVDYRASKWLFATTIMVTFLMCVLWDAISESVDNEGSDHVLELLQKAAHTAFASASDNKLAAAIKALSSVTVNTASGGTATLNFGSAEVTSGSVATGSTGEITITVGKVTKQSGSGSGSIQPGGDTTATERAVKDKLESLVGPGKIASVELEGSVPSAGTGQVNDFKIKVTIGIGRDRVINDLQNAAKTKSDGSPGAGPTDNQLVAKLKTAKGVTVQRTEVEWGDASVTESDVREKEDDPTKIQIVVTVANAGNGAVNDASRELQNKLNEAIGTGKIQNVSGNGDATGKKLTLDVTLHNNVKNTGRAWLVDELKTLASTKEASGGDNRLANAMRAVGVVSAPGSQEVKFNTAKVAPSGVKRGKTDNTVDITVTDLTDANQDNLDKANVKDQAKTQLALLIGAERIAKVELSGTVKGSEQAFALKVKVTVASGIDWVLSELHRAASSGAFGAPGTPTGNNLLTAIKNGADNQKVDVKDGSGPAKLDFSGATVDTSGVTAGSDGEINITVGGVKNSGNGTGNIQSTGPQTTATEGRVKKALESLVGCAQMDDVSVKTESGNTVTITVGSGGTGRVDTSKRITVTAVTGLVVGAVFVVPGALLLASLAKLFKKTAAASTLRGWAIAGMVLGGAAATAGFVYSTAMNTNMLTEMTEVWVDKDKWATPEQTPTTWAAMIGLLSSMASGALLGLCIGACKASKKRGTAAGAFVGSFAGLWTGEIVNGAKTTGTTNFLGKPNKPWVIACGFFINVFGLGTVYSIYPGMAPCSITQFQYFNIIDIWILILSVIAPIVIMVLDLKEDPKRLAMTILNAEGDGDYTSAEGKLMLVAVSSGVLMTIATVICEILVINVLQHPFSKTAQKVKNSAFMACFLTIMMVTLQLTSTGIGFGCVAAGSGLNVGVMNANSTVVLWSIECTSVLGEGYLTELKKYEPGKWPTQGMGKWDTYRWWNRKAFRNAWAIWCCIGTTDLRRDIMLCRQ